MAKWGEGDPRWIVEERPDATNVNNWHWTEKNATPWSKERFNQLFSNVILDDKTVRCTIGCVEKCLGEATANNRKGKLIVFYEWNLLLNWKGCLLSSDSDFYTGKITIPNLSEENKLTDIEITITVDESNDVSELLKHFMYTVGREKIRGILGVYITELKEEYSKNLILPINNDNLLCIDKPVNNKPHNYNEATKLETNTRDIGCKLDDRPIYIEEEFQCSATDLYNALVTTSMVEAFTRGPAKVDPNPGGQFDLYGGHVHGYFDELVPEKRLKLRWRLKTWSPGHYSNVLIEFEERKTATQMKLTQSGVPSSEYDVIKVNWYRYYWHSIKQTFGFGVSLNNAL